MLSFLTACASPSLEFQGAVSRSITIGGDNITVFHKDRRAQAVRTNFRRRKDQPGGIDRLVQAIVIVTKCSVDQTTMKGDIVLITADLRCS